MDDFEEVVETESTKKKRKIAEHQEKVYDAATTRLPFSLSNKGPLYKGVEPTPKDRPSPSIRWRAKKGAIPKPKDKSPIDHKGNRAFENIRDHQISSLFTLQKHLADCEKGSKKRNSTLNPLRTATGEYSPCKKELATAQTDDGVWRYEYSDLPGIFPMKYGMKTFDVVEQIPFNLSEVMEGPCHARILFRQHIKMKKWSISLVPLDRKPNAYPTGEVPILYLTKFWHCASKCKLNQQFGMIILPCSQWCVDYI